MRRDPERERGAGQLVAGRCRRAAGRPLKLGAGDYTLGFAVDVMAPGGSWTTSAVVYAYGD